MLASKLVTSLLPLPFAFVIYSKAKMVTSRLLSFCQRVTLASDLGSTTQYTMWELLMVHILLGLLASLTGLVE